MPVGLLLHVVPFFLGDQGPLVPDLAARLGDLFGLAVERHPPRFDPELAFDASRGQYNSRVLLGQLLREQ